jgi:hypothetical protein
MVVPNKETRRPTASSDGSSAISLQSSRTLRRAVSKDGSEKLDVRLNLDVLNSFFDRCIDR